MMIKRIMCLLIIVTLIGNLCACAGQDTVTIENQEAGDDGGTILTVWTWGRNFNGKAIEIAQKYYSLENPDVTLNVVIMPEDDIVSLMNIKFSARDYEELPDIVLVEDYRIQGYLQMFPGEIRPLSPDIKPEDFMDCKTKVSVYDGKLYGVPFDSGVASLFYRTDYIEQAGYTKADMDNLTWDEFIEIGKTVKEKTGKLMIALDPNDLWQVRLMLQSAGEWYVKSDGKTVNLAHNQALKDAINTYVRIINSGIALQVTGHGPENEAMSNGNLATIPTGTWRIPVFMRLPEDHIGKWTVTSIPRMAENDKSVNAAALGGSGWYVIDKAKHADIAADFLIKTFASNMDLINELATEIHLVDTLKAAGSLPNYSVPKEVFGGQMILKDLFEWTKDVPPVNYGLYTYSIDRIIEEAVQLIMQGADIDETLQNAQIKAEAIRLVSN